MLIIDQSSVKIGWKAPGASAGVHVGSKFVLLHCTKGVNLIAGEQFPAEDVVADKAVFIDAHVFLKSPDNQRDLGDMEFGLAQVSFIHNYEFIYAGRLESEGSTVINLRTGFTQNPSLDEEPRFGRTVDEEIFRSTFPPLKVTPVTGANPGLNVDVTFKDHPNNAIPLTFENRVSAAPNFLASVKRTEEFITYFLARKKNVEPVTILARIGWTVNWHAEFNWTSATDKPTSIIRAGELFPGEPRIGAPDPGDPIAAIALARRGASTNAQDTAAQDAAWNQRRSPICEQKRERPRGLRANLFK
jgi:hypothetical protein